MGIKSSHQLIAELEANSDASPMECDFVFDTAIQEGLSPESLDAVIARLKNRCMALGVDHTKYVQIKGHSKNVSRPAGPSPMVSISTSQSYSGPQKVDISKIVKTHDQLYPFLSKVFLRLECGLVSADEKLVLLYGKTLSEHTSFGGVNYEKAMPLSDFTKDSIDQKFNWVILVLFHSSEKQSENEILRIRELFTQIKYLDLNDFLMNEEGIWKKDGTRTLSHVFSQNPCMLVHGAITAELECLIKDFFGHSHGFLEYVSLKGGFSGSMVLLVSPKAGIGDQKKFVLKISKKNDEKLLAEKINYKDFVEPYWVSGQYITSDWRETPSLCAIRYPFASTDTISDSISFSKLYLDGQLPVVIRTFIDRVFDHKLQAKWRESVVTKKASFEKAFKKILKKEKTKAAIPALISMCPSAPIEVASLDTIHEKELDYIECINHGDFHSDNIQVQVNEEAVFLIDFGLTGRYPAGLDYAMLEASIRFKLLDHSVDSEYLVHNHIRFIDSFDSPNGMVKSFSNDAEQALFTISCIRDRFLSDFSGHVADIKILKAQYLYCLLSICLRQLNYKELNRRYMLLVVQELVNILA